MKTERDGVDDCGAEVAEPPEAHWPESDGRKVAHNKAHKKAAPEGRPPEDQAQSLFTHIGWKSRSGKKRLNSIMIPAVMVNQIAENTGAVVRNFFMVGKDQRGR